MKTAATPLRSLLLTLGALAAVVAVAWSVTARSQTPQAAAGEHPATQTVQTASAEPATPAVAVTPAPRPAAEAVGQAGLKAYVDPESGTLTSIPPQSEALPLANQAVRPDHLPEVTLPDGSVMVDLQGLFEETMTMTVDANGHRSVSCSAGPGDAHPHAGTTVETREVR